MASELDSSTYVPACGIGVKKQLLNHLASVELIMQRKLGRGVAVVGKSQFGEFADRDSKDLFAEAFTRMPASVNANDARLRADLVSRRRSDLDPSNLQGVKRR